MHTPTTTTRENNGAVAMIWSITPGTPTHSKITGLLGLAPSASAARAGPDVPPAEWQPLQFLQRSDREIERRRRVAHMAAITGSVERRLACRVDDKVRAAALRQFPPPHGEVARDDVCERRLP